MPMHRVNRWIASAVIIAPLLFGLAGCGGSASLGATASSTSGGSGNSGGSSGSTSNSVSLSWAPSTSAVSGYMVFRSQTSGGPYTLLTNSPITATSYTDKTVKPKTTYYYVTAAVTAGGVESAYSNQAKASIP
ncbi:MAG: fibronectin type III domain-containing protein [Terriglobales bacterium]